jgi:ribonuclease P/MRP protein subunit RPP40
MDKVTSGLADGNSIDILYTDLTPFDRVSHKELIAKVSSYGIKANVLEWINSFLSNRKLRVVMGDGTSDYAVEYLREACLVHYYL